METKLPHSYALVIIIAYLKYIYLAFQYSWKVFNQASKKYELGWEETFAYKPMYLHIRISRKRSSFWAMKIIANSTIPHGVIYGEIWNTSPGIKFRFVYLCTSIYFRTLGNWICGNHPSKISEKYVPKFIINKLLSSSLLILR